MDNNSNNITLHILPDTGAMWEGLGGNFGNFTEILNEFIDNAISNLLNVENPIKNILVSVEQSVDCSTEYRITIEDTGSGIQNLESAFTIGNKSGQESPLNEHGYGMKHALAAANKANDSWKIYSKKQEDSFYSLVAAPYSLKNQQVKRISKNLPGQICNTHGTIISFNISFEWLKTITKGLRGNYTKLSKFMNILQEDLGYTYGPFFSESGITLTLRYKDNESNRTQTLNVEEVKPSEVRTLNPGSGTTTYDLSRGPISIDYRFLQIKKSEKYEKHYLANMSTSGVEIRINGRLLADNIFSDIWGIDRHNSYNYLLIKINLKSTDLKRLPKTTTNKTSLKQDDPCLDKLYSWIRSKMPTPKKEVSLADDEIDLFSELEKQKKSSYKTIDPSALITTEQNTFYTLGEKIRIDLYQSVLNKIVIYEGKKEETHPKDVYQLLMYWDGLVYDGVPVAEGILIAAKHPNSVRKIVALKNNSKDDNGNMYKITLETWKDENIDYPE